jgi:hypothetical protein
MLFKVTENTPSPKVKDTDFKAFYPAVNRNMDWSTIEPFVQQAEDTEILPAIGQAFYDQLHAEYDDTGTIADAIVAKTFRLLRTALAHYAMYAALPQLNIRIGDAGTNETSASDVVPVRQWVFNQNRWETLKTAARYLDMALEHMEQQVAAENDDYDAFRDSEAYTISRELLIPNARTFQRFYNITSSRRAYGKLRPYIRKAEKMYLFPLLGAWYEEISTQHNSNTLSSENADALEMIQQLLAERTMLLAIPDLNILNDGEGWRVIENLQSLPDSMNLKESVQQLQTRAETNAAQYELQLMNFLYANLDDYPTFRDSDRNELTEDADQNGIPDIDQYMPPEPGAVIL